MKIISYFLLIIFISSGCVALPHKPTPTITAEIVRALEQENFDVAMAYYKAGMLEEALHFFKEVLKLNPENAEAKQFRDKILAELPPTKPGEIVEEKKLPTLPPVREVEPVKPISLPFLIEKEVMPEIEILPKKEEVQPTVEKKMVSKKPLALPEAPFFEFAKELRSKKLYADAMAELSNLLTNYPNTVLKEKINFELANNYLDAGQNEEALKLLSEIMSQKKDFEHDAHLMLAQIYEKTGQAEKARIEYLRLIKILSILPPPKEMGTETVELQPVLAQITPIPQKKEELKSQANLGAGNVSRARGEYRQAIVEYDQAIKNCPKSEEAAEAAFYIADIYDRVPELRDYEQAVEAYTRIITDYPQSKWVDRAKERKKYLVDNYL
ncbi:MAG: tetratricopeptide repeat protein [bacterium]|nr:tetratricopeptide repeat protein [bacterium]